MATIAEKLANLIEIKSAIASAIISKGQSIPTAMPFSEYADAIMSISAGGTDDTWAKILDGTVSEINDVNGKVTTLKSKILQNQFSLISVNCPNCSTIE